MPAKAREDLENNPDFWADLASDTAKKVLMERYNCSSGYIVSRRKEARGPIDESRTREPGESDESVDNGDGTKVFTFIRHRPVTLDDARALVRSSGDNPDHYNFAIKVIAYGGDKSSNKISAWPKTGVALAETLSLTNLYAEARRAPKLVRPSPQRRATIVAIADWQIGKTGRRGGTPELLERLEQMRESVAGELSDRRPERVFLLDGGDGMEGFESGGNPMFTNDLSFPDQIDCYGTELYKTLEVAHRYAPVELGAVPSNHTAWRRAKQQLGRPSDDYGLLVHRQVRKEAEKAGLDAQWHFPDEWDESLCVDAMGTPIGLVHGNQFGPSGAIQWWEKQTFGAQAVTRADVMLTAHYHTFGAGVAGINQHTGRERHWLGLPTNDNGSDHYRLTAGRDSLPGTLIFDVTENGFDLSSLTIV